MDNRPPFREVLSLGDDFLSPVKGNYEQEECRMTDIVYFIHSLCNDSYLLSTDCILGTILVTEDKEMNIKKLLTSKTTRSSEKDK